MQKNFSDFGNFIYIYATKFLIMEKAIIFKDKNEVMAIYMYDAGIKY